MMDDPERSDGLDDPDLESVLEALHDADCRTIVRHLEEPMTAGEIAEECEIPTSTTYRKLDALAEASLLSEGTEIRADGHHASVYRVDFQRVLIALTEDRALRAAIDRPARAPDERLSDLWEEVRREV